MTLKPRKESYPLGQTLETVDAGKVEKEKRGQAQTDTRSDNRFISTVIPAVRGPHLLASIGSGDFALAFEV